MSAWPRAPLSAADLDLIGAIRWSAFPQATVIAVAEAWNAGMTTADMARDLKCKPGSLRTLIGKLVQIGVEMRRAGHGAPPAVAAESAAPPPVSFQPPRLALRRFSWEAA